jgi:hypothetical protein
MVISSLQGQLCPVNAVSPCRLNRPGGLAGGNIVDASACLGITGTLQLKIDAKLAPETERLNTIAAVLRSSPTAQDTF